MDYKTNELDDAWILGSGQLTLPIRAEPAHGLDEGGKRLGSFTGLGEDSASAGLDDGQTRVAACNSRSQGSVLQWAVAGRRRRAKLGKKFPVSPPVKRKATSFLALGGG